MRWRTFLGAAALLLACAGAAEAGARVRASSRPDGAVLENRRLVVTVRPGSAGPVISGKVGEKPARIELVLLAAGGAAGRVGKVEVARQDANEAVLRFAAGAAETELVLGPGRAYVEVRPGKGAVSLEVRARARYAVLPDFFADDVVYDPRRFRSPTLSVPAENFLLQFADDPDAVVMCVWQGGLSLGKKEEKPAAGDGARDPRVDLVLAGEGRARRVAASRIEFTKTPVYVALLEGEGIWHDPRGQSPCAASREDVSAWPGYTLRPVGWKRPFETKWRADFVVADGKKTDDWKTRVQSFEFKGPPKKGAPDSPPWDREGRYKIYQEQLGSFHYPCVFRGDETFLVLYADRVHRRKLTRVRKGSERPAMPNVYERALIYPLDRAETTPLGTYTPVDIMRDTLGQGPCEYILDLEGVKPRPRGGGDRDLLEVALCPLYDKHIYGLTLMLGKGEKLNEKDKYVVAQVAEDMKAFMHAVYDRLREYQKFGNDLARVCEKEAKRSARGDRAPARRPAEVKPLADRIAALARDLLKDVGALDNRKFYRLTDQQYTKSMAAVLAYWDKRLPQITEAVKAGKYDSKLLSGMGRVKPVGDFQDQMVARCRRRAKAIRQEAALADAGDPEVAAFAGGVREMCRRIMQHKHPKEGL